MDDKEVGKYWDENAENWIKLARLGYDRCRDLINSPAFFKMLPDISNLGGLDFGCGEGYNTRIAARNGAKMAAIDISKRFIASAEEMEKQEPLGIKYQVASAIDLPFPNNYFDHIFICFVLEHLKNPLGALINLKQKLKNGGSITVIEGDTGKRTEQTHSIPLLAGRSVQRDDH